MQGSFMGNWWPCVVFCLAPYGNHIWSAAVDKETGSFEVYDGAYNGTSFSSAQVSATIAMIRGIEEDAKDPGLRDKAKAKLQESCDHPNYRDEIEGYGKISLEKALKLAEPWPPDGN